MKARDGRKAASDRHRPVVGSYFADHALQVVQMDHTPADIIIVDEHFRRPLCRPTLTLQIDLSTCGSHGTWGAKRTLSPNSLNVRFHLFEVRELSVGYVPHADASCASF